jgi:hypothetical protein
LTTTVHSPEDGAVLAAEAVSVQMEVPVRPVQSTDEVQPPTEGEEPVVETVGAATLDEAAAASHQGRWKPNGRMNEWSLK